MVALATSHLPLVSTVYPLLLGRIAVPDGPRMSYTTWAHGDGSDFAVHCVALRKVTLSTLAPPAAPASDECSAWFMAAATVVPFWMTASLDARVPVEKWNSVLYAAAMSVLAWVWL